VSKNSEKLLKVLGLDEIATQMLTPEDRELLIRFDEEVDMLKEERGIPADGHEPDELIDEAFETVLGAKIALYRQTKLLDDLLKAGRG
jgi:hypothetical protein